MVTISYIPDTSSSIRDKMASVLHVILSPDYQFMGVLLCQPSLEDKYIWYILQDLTFKFFQDDFHYCVTLHLNMVKDPTNMCPILENISPILYLPTAARLQKKSVMLVISADMDPLTTWTVCRGPMVCTRFWCIVICIPAFYWRPLYRDSFNTSWFIGM